MKERKFGVTERITSPFFRTQFLKGNPHAIDWFGQQYLKLNAIQIGSGTTDRPLPAQDKVGFLLGDAKYLGEIGKQQWGMDTMDAVRCLFDTERTATFIKGIHETITGLHAQNPNQKIEMIEAGGGTGILAIAGVLSAIENGAEIHVTVLEINPTTAEDTKNFISALGLTKYIDVITTDATTYVPKTEVDVIVAEDLSTGVIKEPQVQIMSHLKPYLRKEDGKVVGKLVPQGVLLQYAAGVADWEKVTGDEAGLREIPEALVGEWTEGTYIDFYASTPEDLIRFSIAPQQFSPNAVAISMCVQVTDSISLEPDSAYFLGSTALMKIDPSGRRGQISGAYPPGGAFPTVTIE